MADQGGSVALVETGGGTLTLSGSIPTAAAPPSPARRCKWTARSPSPPSRFKAAACWTAPAPPARSRCVSGGTLAAGDSGAESVVRREICRCNPARISRSNSAARRRAPAMTRGCHRHGRAERRDALDHADQFVCRANPALSQSSGMTARTQSAAFLPGWPKGRRSLPTDNCTRSAMSGETATTSRSRLSSRRR